MSDQDNIEPECSICGSLNGLTFVVLTDRPLEEDEAYIPEEPYILCRDHWQTFVDSEEYYVRELAPVPSKRGGFSRTSDDVGDDILYDRDESDDCWIRFDPESAEVNLADSEEPESES